MRREVTPGSEPRVLTRTGQHATPYKQGSGPYSLDLTLLIIYYFTVCILFSKRGIKDNSIQFYTHFLFLETEMSGRVAYSNGCLQSQPYFYCLEFSLSYSILNFN